jgi:hypothetical protein
MKLLTKLSLIILIFISINAAFAQEKLPALKTPFVFCEVKASTNSLNSKTTVEVDFGLNTPKIKDRTILNDKTGKTKIFNSSIDAINQMSMQGWEFVQAYVLVVDSSSSERYLFKKPKE